MSQCEHIFEVDPTDGQVKCKLCGDFDDEMEVDYKEVSTKEQRDAFYKTQESFE